MDIYELLSNVLPVVGSVAFSVVGSVITVSCTYCKIKRIKFFETFFRKKTDAYEDFIKTVMYGNSVEIEELKHTAHASAVAVLYCSEPMKYEVKKFSNLCNALTFATVRNDDVVLKQKLLSEYTTQKSDIIDSMREDLKRCTKFKFD